MDKKYTKCILTNMVFIKNKDKFLVIDRKKKDWPGISFVGGHIKYDESLSQSAIREVKEETGLELLNLNLVDVYVWNWEKESKYLAFLYYSDSFKGKMHSSKEGNVFWIKEGEIKNYILSTDFLEIYKVFKNSIYFK